MRISRALFDELIEHALEESPREACGMIAFENGEPAKVYRATNSAADKEHEYEISAQEQFQIYAESGSSIGAVYHSHPVSEPYPSEVDLRLAFDPDLLYVIIGLGKRPQIRAYGIVDHKVLWIGRLFAEVEIVTG
jgi:proteasome lid subunit RPN8/RPN11